MPFENKMKILGLFLILIHIACSNKKETPLSNDPIFVYNDENIECIKFVHPQWIDEVTYFDTTIVDYNALVLSAFLKNNCHDTIELALSRNRLYFGAIHWFFEDEPGATNISMMIDSFHTIPPGDSLFSSLTPLREEYVGKIDSMKIYIKLKINHEVTDKLIKISREDF